jgi:hypothetical protein
MVKESPTGSVVVTYLINWHIMNCVMIIVFVIALMSFHSNYSSVQLAAIIFVTNQVSSIALGGISWLVTKLSAGPYLEGQGMIMKLAVLAIINPFLVFVARSFTLPVGDNITPVRVFNTTQDLVCHLLLFFFFSFFFPPDFLFLILSIFARLMVSVVVSAHVSTLVRVFYSSSSSCDSSLGFSCRCPKFSTAP